MHIRAWLSSSVIRQFPAGAPGSGRSIDVPAAGGERVSFQASLYAAATTDCYPVKAHVEAPDDLRVRIRRVGGVPMLRRTVGVDPDEFDGWDLMPGIVPDPLLDETQCVLAPCEVATFWITVDVPRDVQPGRHEVRVCFTIEKRQAPTLTATILVSEVVLEKRRDFTVLHWFYPDAIADWYGTKPFDARFWPLCEKYMRNYAEHGNDTIYVPAFTQPTDGVKRPTQLLDVRRGPDGKYSFGWSKVKRWIDLAKKCGIPKLEWVHLASQGGCVHAVRVYEKRTGRLLWAPRTSATSPTYRNFLAQYLPALKRFLDRENLLRRSFFHVSDEPYGDVALSNYRKMRGMLREIAPWMEVMDALSEVRFAQEGLCEHPVPAVSHVQPFIDAGIPCYCYFCCGPRGRYINRLLETPLTKVRMTAWVCYRLGMRGFLQWGYNYWYRMATRELIDPYHVTDAGAWPGIPYGDPFVVYPGPDGPIDSIRWEVFAESLQDYALLQTLGVEPTDPMLRPIHNFAEFPRPTNWIHNARRKLLAV